MSRKRFFRLRPTFGSVLRSDRAVLCYSNDWHAAADAILDRLVHTTSRFVTRHRHNDNGILFMHQLIIRYLIQKNKPQAILPADHFVI